MPYPDGMHHECLDSPAHRDGYSAARERLHIAWATLRAARKEVEDCLGIDERFLLSFGEGHQYILGCFNDAEAELLAASTRCITEDGDEA